MVGSDRPGARLHRLPQSCIHDACPPALGCLLLYHDHHVGPGHTGRRTLTRLSEVALTAVITCKQFHMCLPVCESGGADDVRD